MEFEQSIMDFICSTAISYEFRDDLSPFQVSLKMLINNVVKFYILSGLHGIYAEYFGGYCMQRMLAHRISQYYGLSTRSKEY